MRTRVLIAAIGLLFGCAERAPAPGTWSDLDASAPDAGDGFPGLGGGGGVVGGLGRDAGIDAASSTRPPECGARVLVIFDRSGSMAGEWMTAAGPLPRWRVASDALAEALEPLATRTTVGAILFPTGPRSVPDTCADVAPIESQIDFRDGRAFSSTWATLWTTTTVGGSTPLDAAFTRADEALPRDDQVTAVVVLTDGMPTCSEPVTAWDRAASWRARGISTWVVGLPGAHGLETLDRIARAGGTESSLSVDDPAALTEALGAIVGEVVEQACL